MPFTLTLVRLLSQSPKVSFQPIWEGMACMGGKLAELPTSKSSVSKGQPVTGNVSKVLILVLVLLNICIKKQGTTNQCLLPTHY